MHRILLAFKPYHSQPSVLPTVSISILLHLGCILLKTRSGLGSCALKHNGAKPNARRADRLRRTMERSKNIVKLWWLLAAWQTKSDGVFVRIHACMSEGKSDQHSYDGRQFIIATKSPLKYF
ncbi:MAG: hypothetical protein U0L47_07410 [Paludibacteraceae bacterium]|nr:hypothetical protein [Paludibacteraceae bacterium]